MIDLNHVDSSLALSAAAQQPTSRVETRARLVEIDDGIAAIRTQIGAADLKRQANRTPIDPDRFHRAKTGS